MRFVYVYEIETEESSLEYKSGAKCIVIRDNKILMVKHEHDGRKYYTLPGGGLEDGETPEQAAIRELWEECQVSGTIIAKTSEYFFSSEQDGILHTFYMDIEEQIPVLGKDPELSEENQILVEIRWMALEEICERDRAFLWASGLLSIASFGDELLSWSDDISYPNKRM